MQLTHGFHAVVIDAKDDIARQNALARSATADFVHIQPPLKIQDALIRGTLETTARAVSAALSIANPLIAVMMSPVRRPASPAPPDSSALTSAPLV